MDNNFSAFANSFANQQDETRQEAQNSHSSNEHQQTAQWYADKFRRIGGSMMDRIEFKQENLIQSSASKDAIVEFIINTIQDDKRFEADIQAKLEEWKFDCVDCRYSVILPQLTKEKLLILVDCLPKKTVPTASCNTLLLEFAYQFILDMPSVQQVKSKSLEHGIEHESSALEAFMQWYRKNENSEDLIIQTGFIQWDENERIGASPDALVKDRNGNIKAIVEIKCPYNGGNHINTLLTNSVDKRYTKQVYGNMLVTGAQVGYFVSYAPNVYLEDKKLAIVKVDKAHAEHARQIGMLAADLNRFCSALDNILLQLKIEDRRFGAIAVNRDFFEKFSNDELPYSDSIDY